MRVPNSTPKDLSDLVYKRIKNTSTCPPKKVIDRLFDDLFYISMKTEEAQHIKVTITLINPDKPDPRPPQNKPADRWTSIKFKDNLPFNVKTITKLSKAADPWSSSLAVYYDDKQELFTWGMIDQALHYQNFLYQEISDGPEQPGIFQVSITGIGCLAVMYDYELLADFKQNILISKYLDVFREGVVREFLSEMNSTYQNDIQNFLEKELPEFLFSDWSYQMYAHRVNVLCRLLIKIQNYKHGGALLITDSIKSGLDIKYKINYDRLRTSIINYIKQSTAYWYYSDEITKHLNDKAEDDIVPAEFYLGETVAEGHKEDIISELRGAVRYVSSLSCVDGLTVLDKNFTVKGFGAIIKTKDLPEQIYVSKTISVSDDNLTPMAPDHFGTRHRSMFSYCWTNKNSLGFVISQDGDIRAVKRVDDKLIVWENIKVLRFIQSRKLKYKTKKKT